MSGFTLLTLFFVGSTISSASILPLSDSSYSGEFGGSGGNRFSQAGNQQEGPITAMRIRTNQYYIVGYDCLQGCGCAANERCSPVGMCTFLALGQFLCTAVALGFMGAIQFRYCRQWSDYVGGKDGEMEEIILFEDEAITQVTGRYDSYIQNLVFITNQGRSFTFGAYNGYHYYGYRGYTFNAVPIYRGTVLRYISGRSGSYINALSFHWNKNPRKSKRCVRNGVEQKS